MIFVQKMSEQLTENRRVQNRWSVHSVFKNGLNLINEENVLFIGTDKNGELPFALHLSFKDTKELLKLVKIGDSFCYDLQTNQLKSSYIALSFDYTIFYRSQMLMQQEINKEQLEKVFYEAEKMTDNNGFKKALPLTLKDLTKYGPDFVQAIKGLFSSDKDCIRDSLEFFIGRGVGLTPSGDDLLVGLLSMDSAYTLLNTNFRQILLELLETKERTTIIAATYLRYAVKHLYSTTLLSFANELSEKHKGNQIKVDFKTILTNGSTSGLDTMTGILLGLLVLKERGIR